MSRNADKIRAALKKKLDAKDDELCNKLKELDVLANKLIDKRKFHEAIIKLEELLKLHRIHSAKFTKDIMLRFNANANHNMGVCYQQLHQYPAAIKYLVTAIEEDPTRVVSQGVLVNVYYAHEEYEAANRVAQQVIKRHDATDKTKGEMHCLLANLASTGYVHIEEDLEKYIVKHYAAAKKLGMKNTNNKIALHHASEAFHKKDYESHLKLLEPLLKVNDFETEFLANFYSGQCNMIPENPHRDSAKAIHFFKQVLAIYSKYKQRFGENFNPYVANAALYLTTLTGLEMGIDLSTSAERMYWYTLSTQMGSAAAWHNLAYEYEEGEFFPIDLSKAIECFERAHEMGHLDSDCDLARLLYSTKADIPKALKLWQKAKNRKIAAHGLGMYYLNLFADEQSNLIVTSKSLQRNAAHIEFNRELLEKEQKQQLNQMPNSLVQLAIKSFDEAGQNGQTAGFYNIGIIHFAGIGVEKNYEIARQYFYKALKMNFKVVIPYLAAILFHKIHNCIDPADVENLKNELEALLVQTDLSTSQGWEEIKQKYIQIKAVLEKGQREINYSIRSFALNEEMRIVERIKMLLLTDLTKLTVDNLVTLIQQIGKLTEKSLNATAFHHEHYASILELINKATEHYQNNKLTPRQAAPLLEGLSKLHLSSNDKITHQLISNLYLLILENHAKLNEETLVNSVFSAVRLDTRASVFNGLLQDLIHVTLKRIVDDTHPHDLQSLTNMIYALAVIDNIMPELFSIKKERLVYNPDFRKLVQLIVNEYINSSARISEYSFQELHQSYLALFYFTKLYPKVVVISADLIERLQKLVNNHCYITTDSSFQYRIRQYLKNHVQNAVSEEVFNGLPVDVSFKVGECIVATQAQGSPHYLRHPPNCNDDFIETSKSRFHTTILRKAGLKVINAAYFEFPNLSDEEFHEFFKQELAEFKIDLGEEVWQLVESKKHKAEAAVFNKQISTTLIVGELVKQRQTMSSTVSLPVSITANDEVQNSTIKTPKL